MNKFNVPLSFYEMTDIIRITQPQSSVLITIANQLNHAHNEMMQKIADYKAEAERAKNMNEYYEAKLKDVKEKIALVRSNLGLETTVHNILDEIEANCHG